MKIRPRDVKRQRMKHHEHSAPKINSEERPAGSIPGISGGTASARSGMPTARMDHGVGTADGKAKIVGAKIAIRFADKALRTLNENDLDFAFHPATPARHAEAL